MPRKHGLTLIVITMLACAAGAGVPASANRSVAASCRVHPATMTAPGCRVVAADSAANKDPESLWGRIDCETADRVNRKVSGGDRHPTASGASPENHAYRELNVVEGDDVSGQRCELGQNDYRHGSGGGEGTFQLYREGQRKVTFVSYKLSSSTPMTDDGHQGLLQMKQTQPSDNGGHSPMLTLNARDGRWLLINQDSPGPGEQASGEVIWQAPAVRGVWVRLALDVKYSQNPDVGRVRVYFDLNGDGDALDRRERSGVIPTATLKYETGGTASQDSEADRIPAGDSIPSHLRVGLYQDDSYDCAVFPGAACQVAIDNVQVVRYPRRQTDL